MRDGLRRLKALSETLTMIPLVSISKFDGAKVSYECFKGTCEGIGLWHDGAVAVQYAEMSAGAELRPHTHIGNREYLIVVSGHLRSECAGVVSEAREGECIVVKEGSTHVVSSPVATKLVGITVPASEGYPNAR